MRICIYSDNRGAGEVHRAVLKAAQQITPKLYVINGDVVKYDYALTGSPEAVLADYRAALGTPQNTLEFWPSAPGPAIFTAVGGHDEQYFLGSSLAAAADRTPAKRTAYEGVTELGVQLYDAFHLEEMRVRVQPYKDIGTPLPMSKYGDYLLYVGSGLRRDLAILFLYRSDRWSFRTDQVAWVDSMLADVRRQNPTLPLLVVAHDWTWYFPDTLDDGSVDGAHNGIREGVPEFERELRRQLFAAMQKNRVDAAFAADRHAYYADALDGMLRVNSGAAICTDADGERVAADNLWVEYTQTATVLRVIAHAVAAPVGCGIGEEAAEFGLVFEKKRAPGAVWRALNQ
ncbi:hypothetical protein HZB60_08155 [candidate division KSB1 bacterium]|nr:hypothetical protein [candidate division KSB1 bacterium]